jgi:hypothetical protein
MKREKRLLFVAQDEGSAKALAPVIQWAIGQPGLDPVVVAAANASRTFRRRGISFLEAAAGTLAGDIVSGASLVVAGASMRVTIEKQALAAARLAGVASAVLLDSPQWLWWRFAADGGRDMSVLPDRIWVPDADCRERMIAEGFPAERLLTTGNPHFDLLLSRPGAGERALPRSVLVVTQPRYQDGGYRSDLPWLSTVLDACRRADPDAVPTVRPHGKEDRRSFADLLGPQARIDEESDILELFESHRLIVGKNSSALLEALLMGRPVVSFAAERAELLASPVAAAGLLRLATSPDELQEGLKEHGAGRAVVPLRRGIPYYTDGRNGERVIASLLELLRD